MVRRIQKLFSALVISLAVSVISLGGMAFAATPPVVTVLSPISQGLRTPVNIAMDAAGNVFVADQRSGGVLKFNPYGRLLQKIATSGLPQAVAIAQDGRLLVSQGDFVAVIGVDGSETNRLGKGAGQFKMANGIAVDAAGYIYVVDSLDNCVQVFTSDGNLVNIAAAQPGKPTNSFGTFGTYLTGQFSTPTAIAYEKASNQLAVVDTRNGRVQFFSTSGVYQKTIGSFGPNRLQFIAPQGVAFEYDNNNTTPTLKRMYVVDTFQSNVQVIDPSGASPVFLSYIGSYGSVNGQLMVPSGALLDAASSRLLVVNGYGNIASYGIDGGTNPTDNLPPTLGIDPVTASVSQSTITITGTVEAGATVNVTTNTAAVAAPVVYTSATAWKCEITALAGGANVITASAVDAAGNVATQSVSVNYVMAAPAVKIDQTVPTLTASANVVITGTVDAGAAVTVANTTTGATGAATVNGTTWSYAALLAQGDNSFTVTAQKPGSAAATATATIRLDSIAPALSVSALKDGSKTSTLLLNIAGEVADASMVTVTVNNQPAGVTDGRFTAPVTLVNGANLITVVAIDLAGNVTTDSRTITFDATSPVITVASPMDNSYTNKVSLIISGSVDKSANVTVNGATAVADGSNWSASVDLVAGINTIEVVASDELGNTSSVKRSVTLDGANPVLAIASPAQDVAVNKPNVTIAGSVSDNSNVTVTCSVNDVVTQVPVVAGSFSFNVDFAGEAIYPVVITAADAAGNVTTTTRNVVFDATAPLLTIDPVAGVAPAKLSGTVEAGASVVVKEGEVSIGKVTANSEKWSADLTGINYNPETLTVVAVDAAGNTSVKTLTYNFPDGDISGDGVVAVADALMALRLLTSQAVVTPQQLAHGDIGPLLNGKPNPNGKIDLVDAILILRKAVGVQSW